MDPTTKLLEVQFDPKAGLSRCANGLGLAPAKKVADITTNTPKDLQAKINELLASLREAGFLAS